MGDELDPKAVDGVTAVLAVFHVLSDLSASSVVAIAVGLVALAALRAACTARGCPDAVAGAVLGAVAAWLCLDSLYDLGYDVDRSSEPDDISEVEYYLVSAHGWAVVSELREADRPLSRAELQDRTGLPDEDFERVLGTVGDSSPIERVGTGYVLDESETGTGARAWAAVRTVGARLLRPLQLLRPTVSR